jgi:hypothetical protein
MQPFRIIKLRGDGSLLYRVANHMHQAYAEGAAQAGIHVLCEKRDGKDRVGMHWNDRGCVPS